MLSVSSINLSLQLFLWVIPLEDDYSLGEDWCPRIPQCCQYNLCLKDLPVVTFLHINIGISQPSVNLEWGNTGIRCPLAGGREGRFTT